ncbi:MAG: SH3 domain-containing protein, partial [Phototrophicaceae bacterium]
YESTADGVTGPDFPPQTQPGAPGGQPVPRIYWTGQYYNNPNLSGSPAAIIGQTGLTFDWGTGSPAPNVSADNFSARWNGVYTLDGGDYEVSVIADDGVRVYLDGTRIIDEWHLASGLTYTRTISPPAGPHTFTVEFFEAQGIASINFQLRDLTTPPDNATSPYNSYATITAGTLNVRTIPSVRPDNIITRVNRDETYPVVGRRDDNVWVQINLGNQTGWISNRYATTTNLENVPVTYSTEGPQPQPTPYTAFTRTEVNLRSGPSTDFPVITIMPQNINVPIVGRNLRATWWQVNYNGTIGWASATFTAIEDGADLGQVPVTN